ncbi:hypothetical protein [Mucilaginibacter sp. KACC 22063]|uniref:hypothetical protein n=1 Tax=Mucilaginibacter sp. KACC 22063 TaxID=3025666 RepID=UPI0023667E8F|nr:hypothetical protein [Mucilaginibacter sp. KACC 22063]WDF57277.1 hypothetical protein PQ461_09450 [Mucilaginibacter sp. KACC 22063]
MKTKKWNDNRRFGLGISFGITTATMLNRYRTGSVNLWLVGALCCLLLITLFSPVILAGPRMLIERCGRAVARVFTTVILTLLYFLVVTPLSLFNKVFKKDPLQLKFNEQAQSYWITDPQEPIDPTKQY